MIYTSFHERCGNQMFFYAISRKLGIMYEDNITFCDKILIKEHSKDKTFKNELENFNIIKCNYDHDADKPVFKYGNCIQKVMYILYLGVCRLPYCQRSQLYRRQTKLQPIINHFGIYDLIHGFSPLGKTKMKNKFVNGNYEDAKWFDDIKDLLQKELTPKVVNEKNRELINLIENNNSVCISIRRGDFLNNENKGIRDICNKTYFDRAINYIQNSLENPVMFFFSDDIEWAKGIYGHLPNAYFEDGTDTVADKMFLMSSCKHFIVSNSTFSWWAQYLSKNYEKIVVSPDKWLRIPGYEHQLIDSKWVLIECE